jgi:GNAT superfamily N-acetyltransferase
VLLTCHYDVLEWLQPDWVFDTKEARFARDCLQRPPRIELEIRQVSGSHWRYFKPHYYLDLPHPVAAQYFVGYVGEEPVCHLAVTPLFTSGAYRATRLVVMPEWQGAGLGIRFLNALCEHHLQGGGRKGYRLPTFFHTSHPNLCAALRRTPQWVQTGARLFGESKARSAATMRRSAERLGTALQTSALSGYGGHFRAVQAFKYVGTPSTDLQNT